jgi:hypothetical protein
MYDRMRSCDAVLVKFVTLYLVLYAGAVVGHGARRVVSDRRALARPPGQQQQQQQGRGCQCQCDDGGVW